MRKVLFIIITIVFLSQTTAFARIGETKAQCDRRYGHPVNVIKNTVLYRKSGLNVIITLHDNKTTMIAYCKIKQNVLKISDPLSDNEIANLLEANSAQEWEKTGSGFNETWNTEDNKLYAQHIVMKNQLIIVTKEFTERSEEKRKAKENKALSGF